MVSVGKPDKRDESTNSNHSHSESNNGFRGKREVESAEGAGRVLPPHSALEALVYYNHK